MSGQTHRGNPCNDLQGFPTELTPRVIPCCIVRIFEECIHCPNNLSFSWLNQKEDFWWEKLIVCGGSVRSQGNRWFGIKCDYSHRSLITVLQGMDKFLGMSHCICLSVNQKWKYRKIDGTAKPDRRSSWLAGCLAGWTTSGLAWELRSGPALNRPFFPVNQPSF